MKTLKILPFLLLTSPLFSQTLLKIKHSCNYYGEETEKEHYLFEATAEARQIIEEVIQFSGLSATIKAHESNCANALATIDGKQRLILYNPNFLRQFKVDARTKWAAYCVLAHEVAHHLNFHDLEENDPSVRKRFELEADKYAGFILYRMGATVDEAQLGIQTLQSENGSNTHPPKSARLVAIANGWTRAYDQSGGVQPKPTLSSVVTKPNTATPTTPIPVLKQDYTESATGVPFQMAYIQGNTFTMGEDKEAHTVRLSDFSMGKTEVTVGEYLKFCTETNTRFPAWLEAGNKYHVETGSDAYYKNKGYSRTGSNTLPIVGVSWDDAVAYCAWLSEKTGKNYRLPTEAEWEFAARGGSQSKGTAYSGDKLIGNVAWYIDNSGGKPHPVGQRKANELGLFDMSGNVWEWCSDWYDADYYKNSPSQDPKGPYSGSSRVLRGGSWNIVVGGCRVTYRFAYGPVVRDDYIGFRVVRND